MRKSSLKDLVERAWCLRDNQEMERFVRELERVLRAIGASAGHAPHASEISQADAPLWIEALLLQGSLARSHGKAERSLDYLEQATRIADRFRLAPPFSLRFQQGIQKHLDGQTASALECFLSARVIARSPRQNGFALLNSLICLIHLGLPHERTLRELSGFMKRNPAPRGSRAIDPLRSVRHQHEVIRLRRAFERGDFRACAGSRTDFKEIGPQGSYFRHYLQEHPLSGPVSGSNARREYERWIASCSYSFRRPYRIRTLQCIQHPVEDAAPAVSEFADRLHIWTWKWLASGEAPLYARLVALARTAPGIRDAAAMTFEDHQMIRNSLLWLRLRLRDRSEKVGEIEMPGFDSDAASPAPLFLAEKTLVDACLLFQAGQQEEARDLARSVAASPAVRQSRLREVALLLIQGDERTPLQRHLRELISNRPASALLRVDPQARMILSLRDDPPRQILSEPMSRAFALLRDRPSVSCASFLSYCFGLPEYDSLIHQGKIFNLLSRMREISPPELRIGIKSGRVFARGTWDRIEIRSQARIDPSVFSALEEKERADAVPLWKLLEGRSLLKRKEIEALTGKSRATAHRLVQKWIKEGVLVPVGNARATRYRVRVRMEAAHGSS